MRLSHVTFNHYATPEGCARENVHILTEKFREGDAAQVCFGAKDTLAYEYLRTRAVRTRV
jgi:hypothetical protein